MLAFRTRDCIAEEHAVSFTHLHSDTFSSSEFHQHQKRDAKGAAAAEGGAA